MTDAEPEKILITLMGGATDFFKSQAAIDAVIRTHRAASFDLLTVLPLVDMAKRSRRFAEVYADRAKSAFDITSKIKLYQNLKRGGFTGVYHLGGARPFAARLALAGVQVHAIAAEAELDMPSFGWMDTDVSLFGLQKPYILLLAGHGPTAWPAVRYAAAAIKLMREGYDVAIMGTDADADVVQKIRRVAGEAKDISGRTSYYDVYALAVDAEGIIGAPSAALHLAAMAGCPVVALLPGTADLQADTPKGDAVTVIQADVMADVTVEEVLKNLRVRRKGGDAA